MTTGFNTSAAANSAGAQTATQTLTIPAGVLAGDIMLLAVEAFATSTLTPTVVSTGTAFTQVGSTQTSGQNSGFFTNGAIFKAVATSSDAGKVITVSGATCFWGVSVAAYTGFSGVDVSGGVTVANNTITTVTCPAETTGTAGDWAVYLCPFGTLSPPVTGPSGATQRTNSQASGVGTAIFDSNGSVGASGTSIGGGLFSAASTCWWSAFTVGLTAAPVTDTGTGSVRLPKLGLAGTGSAPLDGTGSVRIPKMGLSGSSRATGTGSVRVPKLGLHGTGTAPLDGTGSVRIPKMRLAGADSGLSVVFGSTTDGVDSYTVTSSMNAPDGQALRVLAPTSPAAGRPHGFIYALPVESGLDDTFGDGLAVLQDLGAADAYNLTVIAPSFAISPWYGDNPDDASTRQESFMVALAGWVQAHLGTGGEQHHLIGFSKSGLGGQGLLFNHPTVWHKCASWDSPFLMTDAEGSDVDSGPVGGGSADVYGTDANFTANYELSVTRLTALKAPFTSENRIWISGWAAFEDDVSDYDARLTSVGIVHTFRTQVEETHQWADDWVAAALASMFPQTSGTGSVRIPKLGLSGSGQEHARAAGSVRLPKLGLHGSGQEHETGTGSVRLHKLGLIGGQPLAGSGSVRLPKLRLAGESLPPDSGTGSVRLAKLSLRGSDAAIPGTARAGVYVGATARKGVWL